MNEGRTTGIFALIAVVSLVLAWWTNPESATDQADLIGELTNTDVFKDFTDPAVATTLQIIKYNEELATTDRFEVARDPKSKLWTLPSNDDYPADAAEQVRDATTPLIGLKILSVESDSKGDHELFGVVNPDAENAVGASGVGMLVTLKDDKDSVLASLIIGKEVDQAEGQRYVRIPTQDAVYKVEIATEAFKTEFQDWIESELLGVRSFDITSIGVRDYELSRQDLVTMALQRNFDADLSYEASSSSWAMDSMQVYTNGQASPAELGENEELNKEFLNNLRTAIQDLQIVDVKRKPKGLAADLKADQSLLNDSESIQNLQRQGFYPANGPNGPEIYAAGGETIIGKDNGVQYVLRFGEQTATLGKGGEAGDSGINRYLLVTAVLDESKFPMPDLEPVPQTVEEMLAKENPEPTSELQLTPPEGLPPLEEPMENAPESGAPEGASAGDTEAPETGEAATESPDSGSESNGSEGTSEGSEEGVSESKTEESGETSEGNSESSSEDPGNSSSEASGEEGGSEAAGDPDQTTPDPEALPQENQESTQESEGSAGAAEDTSAPAADDGQQETQEELQERLEVLQEKVKKDNQRKLDEREEQMDESRKEVQQLNARFSEWYYVVSDSVYKKIHVNREDLITEKSSAAPAAPAPQPFSGGLPNFPLPQGP